MNVAQGPQIPPDTRPWTIERLAALNEYDEIGRTIDRLLANGEIADYDDEIANRLKDAARIVRGVCALAGMALPPLPNDEPR